MLTRTHAHAARTRYWEAKTKRALADVRANKSGCVCRGTRKGQLHERAPRARSKRATRDMNQSSWESTGSVLFHSAMGYSSNTERGGEL